MSHTNNFTMHTQNKTIYVQHYPFSCYIQTNLHYYLPSHVIHHVTSETKKKRLTHSSNSNNNLVSLITRKKLRRQEFQSNSKTIVISLISVTFLTLPRPLPMLLIPQRKLATPLLFASKKVRIPWSWRNWSFQIHHKKMQVAESMSFFKI